MFLTPGNMKSCWNIPQISISSPLMKKTSLAYLFLLAGTALAPLPSMAQLSNDQAMQRIDRMEHDLMLLQRQVARGDAGVITGSSINADPSSPPANPAQLEVRLSGIENQIRELRGKVEENEFQNRKLTESLDKLQRDVDFRFNELNNKPPVNDAPATDAPAAKNDAADKGDQLGKPEATTAGDGTLKVPEPESDTPPKTFATPREHYNYAFKLLNQTQYDQAAATFDSFTKKYPKDPLVGNAYYWGGETYYIRKDYVNAADRFRQGFEALPTGPKAADNLLKLAMSLNALKRDKEACIVLDQLTAKFKKSSTSVIEKAQQERKRIGCKSA